MKQVNKVREAHNRSRKSKVSKHFLMFFMFLSIVLGRGGTQVAAQDPDNHTLTVISSDANLGSVRSYSRSGSIITSMPNNTSVNFSGTAELIAMPQAGKIFIGWSDSVLNNPRIVDVNQDMTFTAIFDECKTVNIDGITENTVHFRILPNPVIDNLIVELDVSAIGGVLEVLNVMGTILLQQTVSSQIEIISMQNFAAGIYMIKLSCNGEVFVKRVSKHQ